MIDVPYGTWGPNHCTPGDCIWCACMHAVKKEGYQGWYKKKRDKRGIGYESLHIMELLKCAMPTL